MPFHSMRGVFFMICRFAEDFVVSDARKEHVSYLVYISLTTKEIALRIDSPSGNTVNYGYSEQLLGNLSLDLNPLYENPSLMAENKVFYTAHKGLILTVHRDGTYKVVNPATKQVLELPRPPHHVMFAVSDYGQWLHYHAIINLSCPLSSVCSFIVLSFFRECQYVDLYNPITRTWTQRGFYLEDNVRLDAGWNLTNCVFIGETLWFLTTIGKGVAFKFGSLDTEPEICDCYSFSLPKVVRKDFALSILGECHGCLYLSHVDLDDDVDGMWIWKRSGDSWIPLFEISKAGRLCKPVAEEHLGKFYNSGQPIYILGLRRLYFCMFCVAYFLPMISSMRDCGRGRKGEHQT